MALDSYFSTPGIEVALGLTNGLVVDPAASPAETVERIFAFDPESVADHPATYADELGALARTLHAVLSALHAGREDEAAESLNALLAQAPPVPHLVRSEDGSWSLHHHPLGAGLVTAWTSICAEALARVVGEGHGHRVHLCAAPDCGRAFVDTTKNGTRRFCSERCQNRVKAQALRRRRAEASG